jgi:hypothetical protein
MVTHKNDIRPLWIFLAAGAIVGLAAGIVVSVVTDLPFTPEIGLAAGLAAGFGLPLLRRTDG